MEKIPQKKKNVMFASHLQEEDNLEKWRQDGPVVDTEKNRESLAQIKCSKDRPC
jgi:hypothetical protein